MTSKQTTQSRTLLPVAFVVGPLLLPKENYACNILKALRTTLKKHGNRVCRLFHLQVDQCHTVVITQVVSLNNCDLFLFILVIHMKQLYYCKIIEENVNFVVKDILPRKVLMAFPEPQVKYSLGFSRFFSFLHQFID